MTEFWFDTRDGALLVGEHAAAPRLEEAGPDVVSLPELLKAKDFPFVSGDYDERLDVDEWDRETYISYGKWMLRLIKEDGKRPQLQEKHITRLHILGLGPSRHRIPRQSRFGSFEQFKREIGSRIGRVVGKYDDWSLENYVSYARTLEKKLGRKPIDDDYDAAGERDEGPSYDLIKTRIGGVGTLHEHLGYPNIRAWTEDDFVDWGVKAMKANGNAPLQCHVPDVLSKRKRGPSMRSLILHFGTWKNFKDAVTETHEAQRIEEASARKTKLEKYEKLVAAQEMPAAFKELTEDEKISVGARWTVSRECVLGVNESTRWNMAVEPSGAFIHRLRRANRGLTAGHIEMTAVMLDVFDDIWPMDEYENYLQVTDAELEEVRQRFRRNRQASKARRMV